MKCGSYRNITAARDRELKCGSYGNITAARDRELKCGSYGNITAAKDRQLKCGSYGNITAARDRQLKCGSYGNITAARDREFCLSDRDASRVGSALQGKVFSTFRTNLSPSFSTVFSFMHFEPWEMETHSFETSVTSRPTTRRHIIQKT